uniref:Uncharacterized protein n=1 Tax=Anguilla anguilla TaxID=7936 RepID=A0A0E9U7X8_ANGAN
MKSSGRWTSSSPAQAIRTWW